MPLPTRYRPAALGLTISLVLSGVSASRAADLEIVGTGDGIEIIRSIAMAYSARNASTRIIVPPPIGSRGAIAAVGGGHEILGRVAGPLSASEEAQGLRISLLARMPVVAIAHPDVTLSGLHSSQLADVLSGKVANWKTLGGPDLRIRVVARDESDPSWHALGQAIPGFHANMLSARAKIAPSAQDVIETVRSTPGAIGIVPFLKPHGHVVSALALDGRVPGSANYAAWITLGIIFRHAGLTAPASDFIAFADGAEGADIVAGLGASPPGHP